MATETATYEITQTLRKVEIRQYPAQIVAETEVEGTAEHASSEAFGKLAGYIFGKNKVRQKIAMTAPVTQRESVTPEAMRSLTPTKKSEGKYVVRFIMPANYEMGALPQPTDPTVKIVSQAPRRLAVLRYTGTWSQHNYEEHLKELRETLAAAGLNSQGEPTLARYDPPWTPWFMRRNEVMLEISTPSSN